MSNQLRSKWPYLGHRPLSISAQSSFDPAYEDPYPMATMTSTHTRGRTHDRHIQEFIRWINEHSNTGYDSVSLRSFMPFPTLSHYLSSDKNHVLRGLLKAKYGNEADSEGPVPAHEIMSTGRLKIFCILLLLGSEELDALKYFIPFENLKDESLPFKPTHPPDNFPIITGKPNFFRDFCAIQWSFCAPSIMYNSDRELYASEILPIISKDEIKSETGRSAKIYKIKLHDLYNSLPDTAADPDSHPYLVLKTYHGRSPQKLYETEVAAFRNLSNQCPYIVQFYGAFKHGDTYNILLEYADLGSLDDYWASVAPPTPSKVMVSLWSSFFGLVRALKDLQNGYEILWHQDIKPANILILSSRTSQATTPYDCVFKLADFGNSHIRIQRPISPQGTDQDSRGTKAYGAPECYRPNDFLGAGNLRVSPKVDIWSLGCIISEFAVWLYFGQDGLDQYSNARIGESKTIPGFQGGNCFHDGHHRLLSVKVWHDKVREKVVESDTATKLVLDMAEDMLRTEELRDIAHGYCIKAYEIQCRALREFCDLFPDAELAPKMVPTSPPPEPPRRQSRTIPVSGPSRPISPRSSEPPSYNTVAMPLPSPQISYPERPMHNYSGSLPALLESHNPILEYPTPASRQRASLPIQVARSPSSGSQHNNLTYASRGRMSSHSETSPTHYEQQRRSHRDSSFSSPSMNPSIFSGGSYTSPIGSPASPSGLQLGTQFPDSLIELQYPRPSTALPLQLLRPPISHYPSEESQHSLSEVPYMSIEEAEKWRLDNKPRRHKDREPLRESWILNDLNNRESILVIDDSLSMDKHHFDVTRLFSILSYIIKERDKTGLDLVFSSAPGDKHNHVKTSRLTDQVSNKKFDGTTNLMTVMDNILADYGRQLEKSYRTHSSPVPKLNLYIFTDGLWRAQCDLVPAIDNIVRTMMEVHAPQSQIGIQFISFGNDQEGIARLDLLDTGLYPPKLDIIDHTPSSGNIYKMIMGAIDKDFDYKAEGSLSLTTSPSE